jgi:hypothetical protein
MRVIKIMNKCLKKEVDHRIKVQLVNGKLNIHLSNLEENAQYEWTISFDGEIITPTSIGPTVILSDANTSRYMKANKTLVKVTSNNYTSPTFKI